jgi:hypothetical protein
MRSRLWIAIPVLLAAGVLHTACSGSPSHTHTCGSGTPPDLTGSYTLYQYTYGSTVYAVPPSSGTLTYSAASGYAMSLSLKSPTDSLSLYDFGTFEIVGTSCILYTSQNGVAPFSGSFTLRTSLNTTTYRVSGTDGTRQIIGVWIKVS